MPHPSQSSQSLFGRDPSWGEASRRGCSASCRYPWSGLPSPHGGPSSPTPHWHIFLEVSPFWGAGGGLPPCYGHPSCLLGGGRRFPQRWGHPPCSGRMGTGERRGEGGRDGDSRPRSGHGYGSWRPMPSRRACLRGPAPGKEGLRHAGNEDRGHALVWKLKRRADCLFSAWCVTLKHFCKIVLGLCQPRCRTHRLPFTMIMTTLVIFSIKKIIPRGGKILPGCFKAFLRVQQYVRDSATKEASK